MVEQCHPCSFVNDNLNLNDNASSVRLDILRVANSTPVCNRDDEDITLLYRAVCAGDVGDGRPVEIPGVSARPVRIRVGIKN
jgi:hypothetical protein